MFTDYEIKVKVSSFINLFDINRIMKKGINKSKQYWCNNIEIIKQPTKKLPKKEQEMCLRLNLESNNPTLILVAGGSLLFQDVKNEYKDNVEKYTLTLVKLKKGLKVYMEKYNYFLSDETLYTDEMCNIIIQCALFGDKKY